MSTVFHNEHNKFVEEAEAHVSAIMQKAIQAITNKGDCNINCDNIKIDESLCNTQEETKLTFLEESNSARERCNHHDVEYTHILVTVLERELYNVCREKAMLQRQLYQRDKETHECTQIMPTLADQHRCIVDEQCKNRVIGAEPTAEALSSLSCKRWEHMPIKQCISPNVSASVETNDTREKRAGNVISSENISIPDIECRTNNTQMPSLSQELEERQIIDGCTKVNTFKERTGVVHVNSSFNRLHSLREIEVNCEHSTTTCNKTGKLKGNVTIMHLTEERKDYTPKENVNNIKLPQSWYSNCESQSPQQKEQYHESPLSLCKEQRCSLGNGEYDNKSINSNNASNMDDVNSMPHEKSEWSEVEICLNSTFSSEVPLHARLTSFALNGAQEEMSYSNRTTPPPRQTVLLDSDVVNLFDSRSVSMDCKRRLQSMLIEEESV